MSGFNGRRGAGCNAPPCSVSSFDGEDARILIRAFIISALVWSVIIMVFALWEKLREKTEEKEIKQNRGETHHLPNRRGDIGWCIDHAFIGILNQRDDLNMPDHLADSVSHPDAVDKKPSKCQHRVGFRVGIGVAVSDECNRGYRCQCEATQESLKKRGHIILPNVKGLAPLIGSAPSTVV